ncbi:hypothetical protein H9P43_005927 [Blastocladiella emersonii ATCC 22665]|nr:hypothetical protein H9P43_005906 [Blastocladiella emersonii ATCC 22665]KAI9179264.1 hypothetical protein H9P43_005927 [Blastocladiella emersonii ATCC 22665]
MRTVWFSKPYRARKMLDSCLQHLNDFPVRELLRLLARPDLSGLLTVLSSSGCLTQAEFWRQVPDGALDAVRDAVWIRRVIASCTGEAGEECIEELKRVAPIGTSQQ